MTTNRVDFYQSEQNDLTIAAGEVRVFVEGRMQPALAVKKIVRAGRPEFGWARIALIETPDQTADTGGDYATPHNGGAIGKRIKIVRYLKSKARPEVVRSVCIFAGQIERIDREVGKSGEVLEFFARDFSCQMENVTVYGRYAVGADGSVIFLPGLDTIFNEDSEANASKEKVLRNGSPRRIRLFAAAGQSRHWSYGDVIEYLLSLYLPVGVLQIQSAERLNALTDSQKVFDLDLTGLSLAEALWRCCQKTGLGYKFVPRSAEGEQTGPEQAICFFKKGRGRSVEINLQDAGGGLSLSRTDIFELKSSGESLLTNKYIVQGDFKVFEATFELAKGWDGSLEGTNYYTFSPSSNPDFVKVKDVYRKWVLNEAGDYSGQPYNCGQPFDFSHIFGTSNFVRKRRRFWPTITCDKNGKSLGYFLEVSFDGGAHWWQYSGAFEVRSDECAVWLSSDKLDVDTWVAALKGVLRVRITASVISDERISCCVSDGPVNSAIAVREHITVMPSRFKYRKVTTESIFAGQDDVCSDQIDDSATLYEYVRGIVKASDRLRRVGSFKIKTMTLFPDYDIGDLAAGNPDSRDIFSGDGRNVNCVERAEMDFDNQCTQLEITGYRMVSI